MRKTGRSIVWILAAGCLLGVICLAPTSGWAESAGTAQHQHMHMSPVTDPPQASFFSDLLKAYIPRRVCMNYEPPVIWLHVVSDALTALAYYSIPFGLAYFVWRRRDLAFRWMFWLFAAFILACGTTHLFGVLDIWHPLYKVDGIIKLATAILSMGTAIAMWPLIPHALALPSPAHLTRKIDERTAELAGANQALRIALDAAEQARSAAEQANSAKDRFLAVLSHELRTPLTPVVATVAMLQSKTDLDADTREQLEVVGRNAELEARLIDDLLDATRITHGKVELDKRPVELCTILRQAAEVCMPDIEARSLQFGLDNPDGPCLVEADAARLQQVFWNLLKNAIKFTPAGGCVGIRCRRSGTTHVVVEVNDSGEGIAPELLPRLFKPFEQGGRETIRQFGGLGLGLNIAKTLVELHGGTIEARSHGKGNGASLLVTLPLCGPQRAAAAPEEGNAKLPVRQSRGLAILLIEDHGDTARIMRRLLTGGGHEVETTADMATALAIAQRGRFDLLLCDLGLPDGTGWDLLRALRGRGISTPAIALSGFGQDEDIRRSKEAGFALHLTKPISPQRLSEAIADLVGGSIREG